MKRGLKKQTEGSMASRLAKVLFAYRITSHGTTGVSPAELLLKSKPRMRLDLLVPHTAGRVEEKQFKQKLSYDSSTRERAFTQCMQGTMLKVTSGYQVESWRQLALFRTKLSLKMVLCETAFGSAESQASHCSAWSDSGGQCTNSWRKRWAYSRWTRRYWLFFNELSSKFSTKTKCESSK